MQRGYRRSHLSGSSGSRPTGLSSGSGQRLVLLVSMAIGTLGLVAFCVLAWGRSGTIRKQGESPALALRKPPVQVDDADHGQMKQLLQQQSDLIEALTAKLQEAERKVSAGALGLSAGGKLADTAVPQPQARKDLVAGEQVVAVPSQGYPKPFYSVGPGAQCKERFGLGLADVIAASRTRVCDMPSDGGDPTLHSSMDCYPYMQQHNRHREQPWSNFCVARNFVVDFSKVKGEPQSRIESHAVRQGNYHSFERGSLSASCRRTAAYPEVSPKFMPHHRGQMDSFTDGTPPPADVKVVDAPTYLLARDEDCENLFHSMADHMNTYLVVEHVLKLSFQDVSVVLFDRHVDGPFFDLIQTAFSPNHPLKRARDFQGKVMFKTLIFHLESPAGIIFPRVSAPEPMRCHDSTYYHAFRRHVLQAFNLWDVPPPPVPTVVLSVRRRTPKKNVGRVMVNEADVVDVLKEGHLISYQVVDLGSMSFREQLKVMRHCNIYIGIHGAGLMHAYFLAEEAIVMEIHPSYRLDRHFRLAARQAGKIYMPLRLTTPISCQGTSDNLQVDVSEFRVALDGAVRIARNFDAGVAECGLKCNPQILALDSHLDPHYKALGQNKAAALNTAFPC